MAQNLFYLPDEAATTSMNVTTTITRGVITCESAGNQGGQFEKSLFSVDAKRPGTYTICANASNGFGYFRIWQLKQDGTTQNNTIYNDDVYSFTTGTTDSTFKAVQIFLELPPTTTFKIIFKPMLVINAVDKDKFPLREPYKPVINLFTP